ncbi:MAG TPA: hypothetical protein VF715_05600 [Thermoleophilaceae bacterium]|jgi:hypothetical protein
MTEDWGKTASGIPITEELIQKMSAEAEAGYDVEEILARRRQAEISEAPPEAERPPRQA